MSNLFINYQVHLPNLVAICAWKTFSSQIGTSCSKAKFPAMGGDYLLFFIIHIHSIILIHDVVKEIKFWIMDEFFVNKIVGLREIKRSLEEILLFAFMKFFIASTLFVTLHPDYHIWLNISEKIGRKKLIKLKWYF